MIKGLIVGLMVLMISVVCFAEGQWQGQTVYSYGIKNVTGDPMTTVIPTTSIRPGVDKLIGYSCLPAGNIGNTESFIGIFDGTDKQLDGEVFDEAEGDTKNGVNDMWIKPKKIANGVVVRQGSIHRYKYIS